MTSAMVTTVAVMAETRSGTTTAAVGRIGDTAAAGIMVTAMTTATATPAAQASTAGRITGVGITAGAIMAAKPVGADAIMVAIWWRICAAMPAAVTTGAITGAAGTGRTTVRITAVGTMAGRRIM